VGQKSQHRVEHFSGNICKETGKCQENCVFCQSSKVALYSRFSHRHLIKSHGWTCSVPLNCVSALSWKTHRKGDGRPHNGASGSKQIICLYPARRLNHTYQQIIIWRDGLVFGPMRVRDCQPRTWHSVLLTLHWIRCKTPMTVKDC